MVKKVGFWVMVSLLGLSIFLAFFGGRGAWVVPLVIAAFVQVVFRVR